MADEEQRLRDVQREYLDFFDDEVSDCSAVNSIWRVFNLNPFICRRIKAHTWHW